MEMFLVLSAVVRLEDILKIAGSVPVVFFSYQRMGRQILKCRMNLRFHPRRQVWRRRH